MNELDAKSACPWPRYVPETLSEIYDFLAGTLGGAPRFVDETGYDPYKSIDTEFETLTAAFDKVRSKLGEEAYTSLIELSAQAKALFIADPNEENGKTDDGIKLIHQIEAIIQTARARRVEARLKDDERRVTGD